VFANHEDGLRLISIELWRPEPTDPATVRVRLGCTDLFADPADLVLAALRDQGFEVDDSDVYHPVCRGQGIELGFNRKGGEDVDEAAADGLARRFRSVRVAPLGYYGQEAMITKDCCTYGHTNPS
jgi:hypothetical protein